MIDVAVMYPRALRPVLMRSCARARWGSVISLKVRPFLANISLGMKCHFRRSSESNAKTAFWRCSGVSEVSHVFAAPAIADADFCEATVRPP